MTNPNTYTGYIQLGASSERIDLKRIAMLVKQALGTEAVVGMMDAVQWDTWQVCDTCNEFDHVDESPTFDDVCLVCGAYV